MSVSFLAENKIMQSIRARLAFYGRQHGIDKCLQVLLHPDKTLSGSQLAELYALWGDPLTPSDEQFLRSCLAEAGTATGPIMLCGANLLTLILGAICTKDEEKSKQVWCLESDRHWASLIRSWLTEYGISAAHIIQSQARMFDDYVWYAVDTGRLAGSYQLLICNGDRSTPKGVVGVINRMQGRLDDQFTILARNVREPAVLRTLNAWAKSQDAKFALIDKQEGFVKLTRQAAAVQPPTSNPVVPATARSQATF